MNIDLNEENKKTKLHEELHEMYRQKILTKGVVQLITEPTRHQINCKPSLIDHVYSGSPRNIITKNLIWGTSDNN